MAEDDLAQRGEDLEHEIDLDSDSEGDLESAMQEALEAVQKASQGATADDEESGPRVRKQPASAATEDPDVARLEEEIADLRDRSARTLADFDNYRKRIDRERDEERRYAAFDVVREFLSVVDNLERALAADGPDHDLKVGVELILRQMMELIRNVGGARIQAVGEEFDPRYHEAVSQHEDDSVSVPTVSDELQAGYLMHDRLLRPSVVRVAMPVNGQPEGELENDG
jgi:molecular chaperone GrpE